MKQYLKKISLTTTKQFELVNVTSLVEDCARESGVLTGTVVVFCPHTTASIRLNHNEPLLFQDIMKAWYRLVPMELSYSHDLFELRQESVPDERSNGHAHVKAFSLGSSESLILDQGKLILGERQSILFVEFDGGRNRDLYIKILGD